MPRNSRASLQWQGVARVDAAGIWMVGGMGLEMMVVVIRMVVLMIVRMAAVTVIVMVEVVVLRTSCKATPYNWTATTRPHI